MKIIPDISHWEVVKDWGAVDEAAPFIITKATQGVEFVDSKMNTIIKGAVDKNIPYWLYVFLEKGDAAYGKAQVDFLFETVKNAGIIGNAYRMSDKYFMGYILDVEKGNSLEQAKAAFNELLKVSGPYKVMLYTMYADYEKYKPLIEYILDGPFKKRACWWEARYGKNNGKLNLLYPPHVGCALHQYTDKGVYPGIAGNVDLNRMTGRLPLSWFTTLQEPAKPKPSMPVKYSGATNIKFPARGYFKRGDGYNNLSDSDWKKEIKKVQGIVRWICEPIVTLKLDGEFGKKTETVVRRAQSRLGVKVDGYFGPKTLAAAKKFKR